MTRVPNVNKPTTLETLKSISISKEVLVGTTRRRVEIGIPTLDTDGKQLTDAQAEVLFNQTGSHLGYFASAKVATKYLRKLSEASGFVQRVVLAAEREGIQTAGLSTLDFATTPFDVYRSGVTPGSPLLKSSTIQPAKLGDLISLPDIPPTSDAGLTIARNLTSISVSYDIAQTTEVSLKLVDENFYMMENNYFILRRVVKYRGREYEVAVVDVDAEDGIPVLNVKLRSRSVQRMKRDKNPGNMAASNGYELAKKLALKYGLAFYGEQKPAKTQTVVTARTNDNDDSAWNVLTRTAQDGQSVCFEVDGTLIYGSERFLMGKFGAYQGDGGTTIGSVEGLSNLYVPLAFLPPNLTGKLPGYDINEAMKTFELITWPSFRSSENDALEADGSCSVRKPNGCLIRPGHTALVGPLPTFFRGYYLVTSVSFEEATNTPVQVSFRTPVKPESQKNLPTVGIRPGTISFARFRVNPQELQNS
ncbi:MAG: hypothetical protein EBT80_00100 [Chitinophagales bacterium]|nr:hypothetical protein [Chitinophagales bacterium]